MPNRPASYWDVERLQERVAQLEETIRRLEERIEYVYKAIPEGAE